MGIMKSIKKVIAGAVILNLIGSTILSYTPYLPKAAAATTSVNTSSSSIPFVLNLLHRSNQQIIDDSITDNLNEQPENVPQLTDLNSENKLSQEEIDKIVNAHLFADNTVPSNVAQPSNSLQKSETTFKALDEELLKDQKVERFIIKYKNENQKEETVKKAKGNIKERKLTQNKKFDIFKSAAVGIDFSSSASL